MSYRPISRALALLSLMPTLALALPTSPDVQAGGAFLDRVDKATMHITCQDKTVINWDTFSIDHHEALKFIQSADSTVLNRVTGHITGGDISRIMGTLESQGNVYILNPQGIFIGKDATINVGSLIASTLNITNADFFEACNGVKGKRGQEGLKEASVLFSGDSQAKVLNLGTIKASSGDVHVIAYEIENQGSIEAAKGQVSLNACQEAILQPANNRRVLIKAKIENAQSGDNKGKPANASLSETGVKNTGVIKALEARLGAEGSLYKLAINQSGHIEAKTLVADKGGKIFLTAEKGSIKVDGKMVAGIVTPQSVKARPNKSEKGGYIEVLADSIRLEDKADIDVSGRLGGGTSLIGSDYQGKGMPFNSQHTYIGKGANVTASAWGNGNGGKIIFWGDESIEFLGNVTATGGPNGGDGGFVEVSSPGTQPGAFKVGGSVSTLAPKGKTGTLLWDPDTINITSAGSDTNISQSGGDPDTYTVTTSPGTGTVSASLLATALGSNSVIIDAGEDGTINIGTDGDGDTALFDWNANTLTLQTSGDGTVQFYQGIGNASGGNLVIKTKDLFVGKVDHTSANSIAAYAGNITIELNETSGQVGVYSGVSGKFGAMQTAGNFIIAESAGKKLGSVTVSSQNGTQSGIIANTNTIDITLNAIGGGDTPQEILIDGAGARLEANTDLTIVAPDTHVKVYNAATSHYTQPTKVSTEGNGDIRITCKDLTVERAGNAGTTTSIATIHTTQSGNRIVLSPSGDILVKSSKNDLAAEIRTTDGRIDLGAAPNSLSIISTNGGVAYIYARTADVGNPRDIIWDQPGQFPNGITISATGTGALAHITSGGQLNLGSSTNRISKLDIDGVNGGWAYLGHEPSGILGTDIHVYTTGDITLDTTGTTGSKAAIEADISSTGSVILDSSSGALSLTSTTGNTAEVVSTQGDVTINVDGALSISGNGTANIDAAYDLDITAASLTMNNTGTNSVRITGAAQSGAVTSIEISGNITLSNPGGGSTHIDVNQGGTITATGSSSDITVGNDCYLNSIEGSLTVTAGNDVIVSGNGYIQKKFSGSGELKVTAGREVVLNDTAYLENQGGNVIVVTDNKYPAPSADPNVGIGNLKMAAGAEIKTASNAHEIRVYAGYDENNRADINDSAKFNNTAYSSLKGTLDTQDANNRYFIYYNVDTPHTYNSQATFYYKAYTPVDLIQEGDVEGAREIASSAIPSFVVSSYLGDSLLDFLRRDYVTHTKSFYSQYGRAKVPARRRAMGNKTPKDADSSDSRAETSNAGEEQGRASTNTYRSKRS